jgi:hypothetical protein
MTPIVMPPWRDKSSEPAGGERRPGQAQSRFLVQAAEKELEIQRVMLADKRARDRAAEEMAVRRATNRTARLWFWGIVAVVGLSAWAYGVLA